MFAIKINQQSTVAFYQLAGHILNYLDGVSVNFILWWLSLFSNRKQNV